MAKTFYNGEWVETEDCTPTWEGLLPAMLNAHRINETEASAHSIKKEFERMAALADKYNELIKARTSLWKPVSQVDPESKPAKSGWYLLKAFGHNPLAVGRCFFDGTYWNITATSNSETNSRLLKAGFLYWMDPEVGDVILLTATT